MGAADLEGDVGLFKCQRGVGDIQLGEQLAGFYGLADGYEDLLDAAAGAKGEGDLGFGSMLPVALTVLLIDPRSTVTVS